MGKILSIIAGWIGVKAVKIFLVSLYFILVFAFYVFVMDSIMFFYNYLHTFFDYLSSSPDSVSSSMQKFWGLLDCMGVIDAVSVGFPMISSALVFYFSIMMYKAAFKIKGRLVEYTLMVLS